MLLKGETPRSTGIHHLINMLSLGAHKSISIPSQSGKILNLLYLSTYSLIEELKSLNLKPLCPHASKVALLTVLPPPSPAKIYGTKPIQSY